VNIRGWFTTQVVFYREYLPDKTPQKTLFLFWFDLSMATGQGVKPIWQQKQGRLEPCCLPAVQLAVYLLKSGINPGGFSLVHPPPNQAESIEAFWQVFVGFGG
jgi:hypothetical protein